MSDIYAAGPVSLVGPAIAVVAPGGADATTTLVHNQSSPSDTWTINHNLGRRVNVQVFTTGWVEIVAAVQQVTTNQVIVQLSSPLDGFAVVSPA